ncbi:hypothetical protein TYRP_009907 [Tyrophagus putrescentiae]|nr:hypothetical protein TYRP_009907 [Tyrophagus putrescentiae]
MDINKSNSEQMDQDEGSQSPPTPGALLPTPLSTPLETVFEEQEDRAVAASSGAFGLTQGARQWSTNQLPAGPPPPAILVIDPLLNGNENRDPNNNVDGGNGGAGGDENEDEEEEEEEDTDEVVNIPGTVIIKHYTYRNERGEYYGRPYVCFASRTVRQASDQRLLLPVYNGAGNREYIVVTLTTDRRRPGERHYHQHRLIVTASSGAGYPLLPGPVAAWHFERNPNVDGPGEPGNLLQEYLLGTGGQAGFNFIVAGESCDANCICGQCELLLPETVFVSLSILNRRRLLRVRLP